MTLKRLGEITLRLNREVVAGKDWKHAQSKRFQQADIILLLISPSFIASDYHYGIEMHHALEKHEAGNVLVIPIIVRPVVRLEETPVGKLQMLPRNGMAISEQISEQKRDPDAVFVGIVKEIGKSVATLVDQKQGNTSTKKGKEGIFPKLTYVIGPPCISCGARNPLGSVICENCGDLLLKNAAKVAQTLHVPASNKNETKKIPFSNSVESDSTNRPKSSAPRNTPSTRVERSKAFPISRRPFIWEEKEVKHQDYYDYDEEEDSGELADGGQRQLFTALDIGTTYAKAIIVEVRGEHVEVLGVGRHPQGYDQMSDGIVTDIPGVIANCNEALLRAEQAAGGIIAPSAFIGIAGKLVRGSSTTVSKQRQQPTRQITVEELEQLIRAAQQRLLENAEEQIAAETGYIDVDVSLTNAAVISVRIDGQIISNPIGFRGRHFALTLFSAFAPLTQLGVLETVAQGLDLTLVTITAEPCALARCLSANASVDSSAIFIDVGGGLTNIALVRQGDIEEIRMFALGGRTFTRRIAISKGIPIKDAERIKISYSNGEMKGSALKEIQAILASECQMWMNSVESLVEEMSKGELLPPAIYILGGGSVLPDLRQRLESFDWTGRLPFSRQPIIRSVQPEMVGSIIDHEGMLVSVQDITLMALAYEAVGFNKNTNTVTLALDHVINDMHI